MRKSEQQDKQDLNTGPIVEAVGGFFGLLGLGYLLTGDTSGGITRLVLWLAFAVIAGVAISVLSLVGIGLCLILPAAGVWIAVPIWSAVSLQKTLRRNPTPVTPPR